MLTDLRKFNYLGSPAFFSNVISLFHKNQYKPITKIELTQAFYNKLIDNQSNFDGAIQFAIKVNILDESDGLIRLNDGFREVYEETGDLKYSILYIFFHTINTKDYLVNIFTSDNLEYYYGSNEVFLKGSAFQLIYNNVRSFLIDFDFLYLRDDSKGTFYIINNDYFSFLKSSILPKLSKKRKISTSDFEKSLELKKAYGHEAELFVFNFEKNRLSSCKNIDWVALHTVNEGYDIASYNKITDKKPNRFIEVKSYDGETPYFYLSENEYKVAKELGKHYWLYLVNRKYMLEPNYIPIIINDPINKVFNNPEWSKGSEVTYKFRLKDKYN